MDNQTIAKIGALGNALTQTGLAMMGCGCLVLVLLFLGMLVVGIGGGGS